MSLLGRRAPHVAYVQRRATTRTEAGLRSMENVGVPIEIRGMAEPVRDWSSAEESESLGLQVIDLVVWRSREWPGDIHSHVTWNGNVYETVGAPQHHSVSRRTAHFRVTLRWTRKVA